MPFQQPTIATIHHFSFKGKVYKFPVKSVLEAKLDDCQLYIEASPGYLLTTQTNLTPQSQQTVSYTCQPNGSWLIDSTVSIVADSPSLISGSVTLRDPLGESIVITINIKPHLYVSKSTITFNGETPVARLKIIQQGAATPVLLTVENSTQFALATENSDATFERSLTIIPSFETPYVYIQYTPTQIERRVAHLIIKTPYATKTVDLHFQISSLLGWYRFLKLRNSPIPKRKYNKSSSRGSQGWIGLALVLVSGLLYVGYTLRCQLIPSLCQSPKVRDLAVAINDTIPTTVNRPTYIQTDSAKLVSQPVQKNKFDSSIVTHSNGRAEIRPSNLTSVAKVPTQIIYKRNYKNKVFSSKRVKQLTPIYKKPEEVTLEQELNKSQINKH